VNARKSVHRGDTSLNRENPDLSGIVHGMESAQIAGVVGAKGSRCCRDRAAGIRGQRETFESAAAECQLSTPRGPETSIGHLD
jgi:hypothetical protein